ncbi:MAG TPA: hypothetical protein PKD52_01115 [Clostridiales bacterium]|nr:hypothetical protein [Clostridiales bacterium]
MTAFNEFGAIPDLSGSTTEASLKKIQNYLYVLREQMNYVLSNLGVENINESALGEMSTLLTEKVTAKITDAEEHVASLQLTAEGLKLSLADAAGNISALVQSVEGLSLTVKDKDGNTSSVNLNSGALDLENLIFNVLSTEGATVIDGSNIKTGTIDAVDISGVNISGCTITGSTFLTTGENSQIKLNGGKISIYSIGGIFFGSLSFSEMGYVSLSSAARSGMMIYADNDLLIDARSGNTVAIGTAATAAEKIEIGNSSSYLQIKGDQILFTGTVKINGTTLPY